MKFTEMRAKMLEHFAKMTEGDTPLFEVLLDKDKLWDLYLNSFPEGKNPKFRERTEHDCSCCRHFIKTMGNVVAIKDGNVISIWDFDISGDDTYEPSIKAMSEYVHSRDISEVFFSRERRIGTEYNKELTDDQILTWEHFYADIPEAYMVRNADSKAELQGQRRDTRNVFKRSLDEITMEALDITLELISQNSLYRGEENKGVIEAFRNYKVVYDTLNNKQKEIFAWEKSIEAGMSVGRIRNHAIGTLLVDISNGTELDEAVRKYEVVVAPANYKRPNAIFTKKMLEDAKKTLAELGYMSALKRRYATLDDITVNNILFSNRDAARRMNGEDIFDEMAASIAVNPKKFDRVEEISIDNFINNVLPTAKEIEVLFENKFVGNMVSLIAPEDINSKSMFKWANNFCWAYAGNVTDSMKERVKACGGSVTGDLRFSIQWNEDGSDNVDLDAHCKTPVDHIYFSRKRSLTNGELDVDIRVPSIQIRGTDKTAVENITWADRHRMKDGIYLFYVHQYSGRLTKGFRAEIEFDGQLYSFDYPKTVKVDKEVMVARVTLKNGQFSIQSLLPESTNVTSREVWNLNTNNFVPVSVIMYSPNYWDEQNGIGNKHYFFMIKNCINPETPNGFYNEFLNNELDKHKRVMEALGSKLAVVNADDQLSGIGFSSTQHNSIIVKVKGNTERVLRVKI